MTLEDRDILQINATLIAGALIFLTISSFASTHEERVARLLSIAFSLGLLLFFSISSFLVVIGHRDWGKIIMKVGFGWMIFNTFVLLAGNVITYFEESSGYWSKLFGL